MSVSREGVEKQRADSVPSSSNGHIRQPYQARVRRGFCDCVHGLVVRTILQVSSLR